jgi:hypothetical protein
MAQIHLDDVGTRLLVTVRDETGAIVDLSDASLLQFTFKRPDGSIVVKPGTLVTDGLDGQVSYTPVDEFDAIFDMAGSWQLQGFFVLPDGSWHTGVASIYVAENLVSTPL